MAIDRKVRTTGGWDNVGHFYFLVQATVTEIPFGVVTPAPEIEAHAVGNYETCPKELSSCNTVLLAQTNLSFLGRKWPDRKKSATRQWMRRLEGLQLEIEEDLRLLETGSLSKRQLNRIGSDADAKLLDLEERIDRNRYGIRRDLRSIAKPLRKRLDAVRGRDLEEDDPLSAVPYAKRLAFQEVFELIYTNAQNKPVANGIVERITNQLAAKYGAK